MTPSATTFVPTGVCHDTADAAPATTNALAAASATAARFTSSPFVIEHFQAPASLTGGPCSGGRSGESTYLNAIIDCCTREIVGWSLELRCRADEAITVVEHAAAVHAIEPGELVLGSDNGSAFTARRFRTRLGELGIRHRRGGYRDPESQAFIESWFGKLKEREVWLNEYETLDDARHGIGGYVDRYHHRPHSSLNYRTPLEVRQTWEDLQGLQKTAA